MTSTSPSITADTPRTHVLGVDVAKDTLSAALYDTGSESWAWSQEQVPNSRPGYDRLVRHLRKCGQPGAVAVVLEATGVYHENLVDHFHDLGYAVYVCPPKAIKDFAASQRRRGKTDPMDARTIALFGASIGKGPRQYDIMPWKPYSPLLWELRSLCRQHLWLSEEINRAQNRLHASRSTNRTPQWILGQQQSILAVLEEQKKACAGRILSTARQDHGLWEAVQRISRVPCLGVMTVLHILAQTDGFALIRNLRQLTAYAGLDVPPCQSGTLQRRGGISHKGNSQLRRVLFMAALQTPVHGAPAMLDFYQRVLSRSGHARVAQVAVMRKYLLLIYTLWRNGQEFDPHHQWGRQPGESIPDDTSRGTSIVPPASAGEPSAACPDTEEPIASPASPPRSPTKEGAPSRPHPRGIAPA